IFPRATTTVFTVILSAWLLLGTLSELGRMQRSAFDRESGGGQRPVRPSPSQDGAVRDARQRHAREGGTRRPCRQRIRVGLATNSTTKAKPGVQLHTISSP